METFKIDFSVEGVSSMLPLAIKVKAENEEKAKELALEILDKKWSSILMRKAEITIHSCITMITMI